MGRPIRLLALRVGVLYLFALHPPIHAQNDSFWSFLKPGRVITPCPASSAAHKRAAQRLEDLRELVTRLRDDEPVVAGVDALHALLKSECFLLASETDRVPAPDTSMSLKRWWDSGGADWLKSYLELPRLGYTREHWLSDSSRPTRTETVMNRHVVVPPDARRTLTSETGATHVLREFLCPANSSRCANETKGWRERADAFFDAHAGIQLVRGVADFEERPASGPPVTSRECARKAGAQSAQHYRKWRTCLEDLRPKQAALPLGDFKAPATGWLIVSGRRGHYVFCDTMSSYDLATGAAFVYESCSALAMKEGGHVDREATNRARVERVKTGTVPVENLREAVWMLLFRGEAEEIQARAEYYPLPPGMRRALTVNADGEAHFFRGAGGNTGQTLLTWQWVPPEGEGFVGKLTWPSSDEAAESHAAALLDVAERGLVERCPPVRPLDAARVTSMRPIRLNEVETDDVNEMQRHYTDAAEAWRARASCSASIR